MVKKTYNNLELESDYKRLASLSTEQILKEYQTTEQGLDQNIAEKVLDKDGKNVVSDNKQKPWYLFLFKSFVDEFILVLLLLGIISIILKDPLGAGIIFGLAIISAMLRFVQDYNAYGGNAYGLANTLNQTAVLKPKMRNKKVNNLFYTGQLTVPGPGVPPSIISGKIVANEITKFKTE